MGWRGDRPGGSFRPCLLIRVSVENTHRGSRGSRRPRRPRDSTGSGTHLVALLQQELGQVGAVLEDKEEGQRQTHRSHDRGLRTAFQGLCGRKQGPQQPTRKTVQTTPNVSAAHCSAVLSTGGSSSEPTGGRGRGRWHHHPHRESAEVQGPWGQRAEREASEAGGSGSGLATCKPCENTERVGLAEGLGAAGT